MLFNIHYSSLKQLEAIYDTLIRRIFIIFFYQHLLSPILIQRRTITNKDTSTSGLHTSLQVIIWQAHTRRHCDSTGQAHLFTLNSEACSSRCSKLFSSVRQVRAIVRLRNRGVRLPHMQPRLRHVLWSACNALSLSFTRFKCSYFHSLLYFNARTHRFQICSVFLANITKILNTKTTSSSQNDVD